MRATLRLPSLSFVSPRDEAISVSGLGYVLEVPKAWSVEFYPLAKDKWELLIKEPVAKYPDEEIDTVFMDTDIRLAHAQLTALMLNRPIPWPLCAACRKRHQSSRRMHVGMCKKEHGRAYKQPLCDQCARIAAKEGAGWERMCGRIHERMSRESNGRVAQNPPEA